MFIVWQCLNKTVLYSLLLATVFVCFNVCPYLQTKDEVEIKHYKIAKIHYCALELTLFSTYGNLSLSLNYKICGSFGLW